MLFHRLFTCAFLHDSFSHLALNSYALYTVAPQVEKVLGYWTFLSVYLLTGLAGSSAAYIFGDAITVGASNCIFGLIGTPSPTTTVTAYGACAKTVACLLLLLILFRTCCCWQFCASACSNTVEFGTPQALVCMLSCSSVWRGLARTSEQ